MIQYLTIDVEGIESFNEKCNQLSNQGWFPNTPVSTKIIPQGSLSYTRYIQQWSLVKTDEPGPDKISTEAL